MWLPHARCYQLVYLTADKHQREVNTEEKKQRKCHKFKHMTKFVMQQILAHGNMVQGGNLQIWDHISRT